MKVEVITKYRLGHLSTETYTATDYHCPGCGCINLKLIYKIHEPFWECQHCGHVFNIKTR